MLCLMLPLMTSCADGANNSFCYIAHPIYLDKKDVVTPATGREILKHDLVGENLCGWQRV